MTGITPTEAGSSFAQFLTYGHPIRVKYYLISGGSASYDDDITLTQSGTDLWDSGITQPIHSARGTFTALLLEQGKLLDTDQVLYIKGSTSLSGAKVVIGIGSPCVYESTLIPDGVVQWNINGSAIYNKVFIRRLTTGSLI